MIRLGLSTSSVYPLDLESGFRLAQEAGFDGVEVMVTRDKRTQNITSLRELSDQYSMPILSVHAPVLLLTHFVWGTDPQVKLEKTAELTRNLGASTVVVHPPFRWQAEYSENFLDIVRSTSETYGVEIAVENMFPWTVKGKSVKAYAPGWDVTEFDCEATTLDFSHAALSGQDSFEIMTKLGERLRHVHLCDGSGSLDEGKVFDEHLLPGRGGQPVSKVLRALAMGGWSGSVVAEVNTRKAKTPEERLSMLIETREFAQRHTNISMPPKRLQKGMKRLADLRPGG
ncbi:sugar phosphate isomerase/epimerase family protein [Lysinibacter cavernae]|uniref:Sugar phosphate isomerase/epimerase n=1 Tax=Lysinibacter cavernae TaxID=1640652 RepID=A0A7X5R4A4_9MICO|nr:sugar phosphate isomerase/epimerase [Lysinibacter cavernae]NIH55301.1 sugar phosphate isomerase/epimerase [Lysinibacter cavernae]